MAETIYKRTIRLNYLPYGRFYNYSDYFAPLVKQEVQAFTNNPTRVSDYSSSEEGVSATSTGSATEEGSSLFSAVGAAA